jgi:hypothetical protein
MTWPILVAVPGLVIFVLRHLVLGSHPVQSTPERAEAIQKARRALEAVGVGGSLLGQALSRLKLLDTNVLLEETDESDLEVRGGYLKDRYLQRYVVENAANSEGEAHCAHSRMCIRSLVNVLVQTHRKRFSSTTPI